ncbi:hypothetical protein GRF59_17835 [Paenibacillus sp. HJL G12]|uniref:Uncharacterized protein n=1 Tax=Paenibacillus dendrobii TaxID=2691084 RepID=A0A7X3LJF7_9BACL|nr:hypothetical protein [Paenibacillus dendrobii]MWV45488.1 hypothetical protein [Paenibacillus dendrobii]
MTKQIQAYFKTEDDAESAKTQLIGTQTEHLEVSRLGTTLDGNRHILLPIATVNMVGNMNTGGAIGAAGVPGMGYAAPVVPVENDENDIYQQSEDTPPEERVTRRGVNGDETLLGVTDANADPKDYQDLEYVLSCKVQDGDYSNVLNKLRNNGGYVEIFD